jgi:endoglycosylceramidase
MLPWMFWAYNENIMSDREGDASLERVNDLDGFRALVRPYPRALTGVPEGWSFDAETRAFELTYGTTDPEGETYPDDLESVVFVPELIYATGYEVEVTGGEVSSERCAQELTILTDDDADQVTVTVTPAEATVCG